MPLRPLSLFVVLAVALVVPCLVGRDARAQGAAISTQIDPSVRASGMGRATTAAWWGGDPDYASNPALLGYHAGIRYEHGRTQLIPEFADDVYFTSKRVTLGAYGLGIALGGKPIDGLGSLRLSYGLSEGTGPGGEPLGTFESYEDISSFGIGLSLAQAAEAIGRAAGASLPPIVRYGDIALGMTKKDVFVLLGPDFSGTGDFVGEGSSEDRGILVRVTPYDTFRPSGGDAIPGLRARFDLAYGGSTINRGQPPVEFGTLGSDPMAEQSRRGWSARVALHPTSFERGLEDAHLGWLARSLSPVLAVGTAWEDETIRSVGFSGPAESAIDKNGWEATVFNIFTLRRGHYADPDAEVDGPTSGWGLGFTLAGAAGVRYDRATVPQATGLADVKRKAWTVFVDPLRALREF